MDKISLNRRFLYLTFISAFLWNKMEMDPVYRSTVHSIISLLFSRLGVPELFTSTLSSGYFLIDLKDVVSPLYLFHHLYGVYELWNLLHRPYTEYNLLNKSMIVEASTPMLNLYLHNKKTEYSKPILGIYLLFHIYFRNYILTKIYMKYIPKMGLSRKETTSKYIFLLVNYYWTLTTFKCLIKKSTNQQHKAE